MAEPPFQGRAYIVGKSHQFLCQSQPDHKDNDDKDKDDKDKDEGKNLEEEEITVAKYQKIWKDPQERRQLSLTKIISFVRLQNSKLCSSANYL